MKRKMVSAITLTLLLTSMLTMAFNIQPVKATGTIYIRADGSIDPPTSPIQRDGDVYTLTSNITTDVDGILIERSYITVEGDGYSLQGPGGDIPTVGFDLFGVDGVTIRRTNTKNFWWGIRINNSSHNSISGNNITANTHYGGGIALAFSSHNSISGNNITANETFGIYSCHFCSNNSISGNNITAHNGYGVYLDYASNNNSISGNNIVDNRYGIWLVESSDRNMIYHNNFIDNSEHVHMSGSPSNTWDDGYPSGGNYWSDYSDVDQYSGPNQDQQSSDGIWDHPYIIDANNKDRYPLVNPWTPTPPWPMFGHDPQHTRRSPYRGAQTNELKWRFTTGGSIYSSPSIGPDSTIYVGSYDCKLYAINLDGTLKWSYMLGSTVDSSPAIDVNGNIYVGCADSKLYAIKPDGSLKWTYATGGSIESSPCIGPDGIIYVGSNDDRLYAINPDGTLRWSYKTGGDIIGDPALSSDGVIYVGSLDKNLYAFNSDGTLKWRFTTGGSIYHTAPAISPDGTIYVGSGDYSLYAIKPDGTLKWSYHTGYFIASSPGLGSDGTIYIGSYDNSLYAIRPDGTLKWRFTTGDDIISSPAIGLDGTIYIGSKDRIFYAINPDGTLKWSYTTGGRIYSSPSIDSDGTVYVGSLDYNLYAFGITPPAPDFSIAASPTSLSIQQGSSGSSTITITSISAFNQPVQLTASGIPSGVTATLNPQQVTPPAGGSITSTLTVSVDTTASLGSYTLSVTGTNGTITHSVDISLEIAQVGEWSFAVITDLHIGWGYCDYGDVGYDDANLETVQGYWLTKRLEKVVEKIIQTKNDRNIKFVVVLGDITDTAEKSEFLKVREILSMLNDPNGDGDITDGIPYIPVIGNHDIWPYTMTQGTDPDKRDEKYVAAAVDKTHYNPDNLGDRYFQKTFWEDQESQNNRDLITRLFGSSWENQTHSSAPYLQNYKFRFGDMNFVCLDFNPRDPFMAYPGSKLGALVQLFGDTTTWLNDFLNENKGRKVVVLCHHPLSFEGGFIAPNEYVNYFKKLIKDNEIVMYDFGGHTHVNDVSNSALAQYVVETEAVFQESAEVIRIVKVNGQQINYNMFEGVADSDPGLSLFFTFSPGNPSNNQDIHFVVRTVDFAEDRSNWRFSKELGDACLSCYYDWSFGDGESLQGWGNPIPKIGADDPKHSYDYAGAYRLDLTVNTPEGTVGLNGYPIFISGELSPIHYICGIPENFQAVSTGRGVSVAEGGDGQNTFERVLISKTASPETPIVEFGVHFENATEDVDLSTFAADVNTMERKSFFCMPSWPEIIEESKTLYIPSTGVGAVYVCFNAKSLDEVGLENADVIIHVGETINGITVTTTFYNGTEYYIVSGVIGTGGGELPTYALTITTTVGGTTDPAPGTYSYTANSPVQVTAIPNANYLFDHWELDSVNVGSANPYSVTMDKNHTLKAVFSPTPPPLSASISPLSASLLVGQSITFTSTVSGGYTPYSYQWYLSGNPVSDAISASWTFTPTTSGIYYIHLRVVDSHSNTTQSETAQVIVQTISPPVGGYSTLIPIQVTTTEKPLSLYLAIMAILTAAFTTVRHKTHKRRK